MGDDLTGVVVVAEAGPNAGLGHLARSSGLAAALSQEGVEVSTYAHGVDSAVRKGAFEWLAAPTLDAVPRRDDRQAVVVDSYEIPAAAARELAAEAPLLLFDDSDSAPTEADIVVSPFASHPASKRVLTGAVYCCLGPDYWQPPKRSVAPAVETILVTTGGGDPTGRAGDTAQAIAEASPDARTTLVAGPYSAAADEAGGGVLTVRAPDSLHDLLAATDLAVITAGQTMLEALALGTPAVAVPAAENQRSGAESLAELGAIVTVEQADPSAIGEVARELARDPDRRQALSAKAQETIDGGGAIRVARRLLELSR